VSRYYTADMAESVDQKLLKQTKFPLEFGQKVDMQKVNIEVMKKSVASSHPPGFVLMVSGGLRAEYQTS